MMHAIPPAAYLSGLRLQGWAVSLLLHAVVGGAALLTLSDLTLLPLEEPFRWNVSIVRTTGEAPAAPATPDPVADVTPTRPAPPAETRPPVVEPVPPAPQEVQTEPEPVRTAAVMDPVPPTPREVLRHEMEAQTEETATPKVVAKAVTQTMPAELPAAVATPARTAQPSDQPAQAASRPVSATQGPKADYGWLARSLWERVAELKRYPHRARLNHWEGKVVLRAVIRHDGHLADLVLHESSGYEELDEAAIELVREACPLHLTQPLGREQVIVQVPITYALR